MISHAFFFRQKIQGNTIGSPGIKAEIVATLEEPSPTNPLVCSFSCGPIILWTTSSHDGVRKGELPHSTTFGRKADCTSVTGHTRLKARM